MRILELRLEDQPLALRPFGLDDDYIFPNDKAEIQAADLPN